MSEQERGLQDDCHPLDQAPGMRLDVAIASELALQLGDRAVEAGVPGRELDLREVSGHRVRLPPHGAKDVKRVDVARALPDRVQGRFAVQAREYRLLDVAVAAVA